MKVILLNDIPKFGRKLEVKEVSGGYARNYLLPKKLAEYATDATMKTLEARQKKHEAHLTKKLEELGALFASLNGKKISVSVKANEEGHLFAGIRNSEIRELILRELKLDVPEDAIELEKPIKEVGEHEIVLKASGKEATIVIDVQRASE